MSRPSRPTIAQLRHRLYGLLEHGPVGDRAGRLVGQFIVARIVVNLVAVVLESVPAYEARFYTLFAAIELFSLVVFTLEYALRVWVAVEHAPYRHLKKGVARWRFITSPLGIVDLLAVVPFWLAFVGPADLRVVLVFRFVRFLKLARYSPSMRSLLAALYGERRALFGCFVILRGRPRWRRASCIWSKAACSRRTSAPSRTRCGGRSSRSAPSATAMSSRSPRPARSSPPRPA
jgi:voltage-gated potassium channel